MLRLSDGEFAELREAARDAGLPTGGYAALSALAAARRTEPPAARRLTDAAVELNRAWTRLSWLEADLQAPVQQSTGGSIQQQIHDLIPRIHNSLDAVDRATARIDAATCDLRAGGRP